LRLEQPDWFGTSSKRIFKETMKLIENERLYQTMAKAVNPCGDGKASERMCGILDEKVNG
jgi:UDP-N-acetylglucosamine 2-epimerase